MQSALRSAVRRSVGISSRRGVATTTTTKAAAAGELGRERVDEKAWVAAMVQREVRAQMAAEEERRITRDRLHTCSAILGVTVGAGLAILLFDR